MARRPGQCQDRKKLPQEPRANPAPEAHHHRDKSELLRVPLRLPDAVPKADLACPRKIAPVQLLMGGDLATDLRRAVGRPAIHSVATPTRSVERTTAATDPSISASRAARFRVWNLSLSMSGIENNYMDLTAREPTFWQAQPLDRGATSS